MATIEKLLNIKLSVVLGLTVKLIRRLSLGGVSEGRSFLLPFIGNVRAFKRKRDK